MKFLIVEPSLKVSTFLLVNIIIIIIIIKYAAY